MSRESGRSRAARNRRRHMLLALASGAIIAGVWLVLPEGDAIGRLTLGSAYAAMVWLCGALVLGPLRVLRGRVVPVSFDLRRSMGIWAGLLSLVHVIVGLQTHYRGRMWLYFLDHIPDRSSLLPIRLDLFGVANHLGLLATVVLLMLLMLSNDLSLRRLGVKRWKRLQRWCYVGFVLVIGHGVAYQVAVERTPAFIAVFGLLIFAVVAFQMAGYRRRINPHQPSASSSP